MEEEICPICKSPSRSASKGRLTQWIVGCQCYTTPKGVDAVPAPVELCSKCGKRKDQGRSGSFTQYIFRFDTCSCDKSGMPVVIPTDTSSTEFAQQQIAAPGELEQELDLPAGTFPSDRFVPIAELGSGANGTVYLARDNLLNKKVAVKVLRRTETANLVAFQREARATCRLKHAGIVEVLDFCFPDDMPPYMVLEYFPGISLEKVLESDGPINWQTCIAIFEQLCAALSYAHKNEILHRDLKPGNILLARSDSRELVAKLIDFGIAKIRDEGSEKNNSRDTLVGTPSYMSPDVARGLPHTAVSEVYSLGCVLFEALTGEPPFVGELAINTLTMHATQAPPRLDSAGAGKFPEGLEDLVALALSKSPEQRFQSMDEFRSALLTVQQRTEKNESFIEPEEEVEPKSLSSVSNKRIWPMLTFVIAIILISSAVFVLERMQNQVQPSSPPGQKVESSAVAPEWASPDLLEIVSKPRFEFEDNGVNGLKSCFGKGAVTDKDLTELSNRSDIGRLHLSKSQVKGSGLSRLSNVPITSLFMRSTPLDDEGASCISKMKRLEELDIVFCENLSDSGLQKIASLPRLKALLFHSRRSTGESYAIVSRMPLEALYLHFDQVPDFSLAPYMKNMTRLKRVWFDWCGQLTEEVTAAACSAPALEEVGVRGLLINRSILSGISSGRARSLVFEECTFEPGLFAAFPSDLTAVKFTRCFVSKTDIDAIKSVNGKIRIEVREE